MRKVIILLFFASGLSSLIFQVVWQRKLFTIFGVNLECTTVIVSVFMAGLGLGSLLGGWIAKRLVRGHLAVFGVAEIVIGIYGFISLPLIVKISEIFAGSSLVITTVISFSLLVIPTLLMGLTLPILITYLNEELHDVGVSVGKLYFTNTFGAATGVFLCGFIFLELWGLSGSVVIAGSINIIVGFTGIFIYLQNQSGYSEEPESGRKGSYKPDTEINFMDQRILSSILLSFVFGFVALSYEILFFRLGVYIFHNLAYTFPGVLVPYLAGIAIGSTLIKKWCSKLGRKILRVALFLELAWVLYLFLAIPLCAIMADQLSVPHLLSAPNIAVMVLFDIFVVFVPALAMGATFPLLCHHAVETELDTGPYISYIYFANTIGATVGTFVTGMYLIGTFGLRGTMDIFLILGLALYSIAIIFGEETTIRFKAKRLLWSIMLSTAVFVFSYRLLGETYEHLFRYRQPLEKKNQILVIDETKYGVTVLTNDIKTGYRTMYGNGVYDARATVYIPTGNERALLPVFFNQTPKEIFQIGLGTGAWAKILAANPDVEKITIVEINDACIDLVSKISEVASIITNPKTEIIIDDGRRWLNANPERRFDFFCFNTTFNNINFSGNVLSYDFYEIIKKHMKPGALILVNPTRGMDAYNTFAAAFPYVHVFPKLNGVLIGSLAPFKFNDTKTTLFKLKELEIPEGKLLDLNNPIHLILINNILRDLKNKDNQVKSNIIRLGARLITDNYLPNEYYLIRYLIHGPQSLEFSP